MDRTLADFRIKLGRTLTWLIIAAWFGMLSGLLELGIFLLKCHVIDPRNYNMSCQFPWMFIVAGLFYAVLPGIILAVGNILLPNRLRPVHILAGIGFPAFLSLIFRAPIFTGIALFLAGVVSFQTARFLADRLDGFERLVRRSVTGMFVVLLVTIAGLNWGPGFRVAGRFGNVATSRRPDVLLIVLDTVRASSLSLYGYERSTTPNLERFARRGVVFNNAFSTAPWTAPSHASMFTGRWSHELSVGWDRPLDASHRTIAEVISNAGYNTAGFVANATYCSYETGLSRGFAHYEDYEINLRSILLCSSITQRALDFLLKRPALARWFGEGGARNPYRKSAARINRDYLSWVANQNDRPTFAFLNYFDAHHPYFVPEEEGVAATTPNEPSGSELQLLRTWWDADKSHLSANEVRLARDAYERCIAYLDRQIGKLLDELERTGRLDRTLVIITADHGEHLGEHQLYGHGTSLYRPELHVPLLILGAGVEMQGLRIDSPVSLRDIPATISEFVGLPSHLFPGRSLSRTWRSPAALDNSEPILSTVMSAPEGDPNHGKSPATRGPLHSRIANGLHWIRDRHGNEELYDLRDDPDELHNLVGRFGGNTKYETVKLKQK